METVFRILLVLHILGGSIALFTGYAALWVKRGGTRHRQFGRWYVRGMVIVLITGFPMSIIHPNVFLFGIVFFTAYFVWSGRSSALNRQGDQSLADYAALGIFFGGAALALIALGYDWMVSEALDPTFRITGTVFAAIAVFVGGQDILTFRKGPIIGTQRIERHLTNMCAALIATTTAVAVTMVNYVPIVPPLVSWIGPTVIVTPLIIRWTNQIRAGTYKY